MSGKLRQVVKQEIEYFIDNQGLKYSAWYVGIASNPKDRLFNGHCVDKDNGTWIYRQCMSCDAAPRVRLRYYVVNGGITLKSESRFVHGKNLRLEQCDIRQSVEKLYTGSN